MRRGQDAVFRRWHLLGLMNEAKLIEKLRLIEALFAGATTEGEQAMAG